MILVERMQPVKWALDQSVVMTASMSGRRLFATLRDPSLYKEWRMPTSLFPRSRLAHTVLAPVSNASERSDSRQAFSLVSLRLANSAVWFTAGR
jgi:hypothetical protein